MKIIDININEIISLEKSYVALGNFDGIHRAHSVLIKNCVDNSIKDGVLSTILLFKEHSMKVLKDSKFKILMSLEQKLIEIEKMGIDQVYLVSFDDIKNLTPEEFIKSFMIKKLNISGIFVGFDYAFGKNASGDINFLRKIVSETPLRLEVMDEIQYNSMKVSSTNIRNLIESDNLENAELLLGHEYWLKGVVVEGKKLGSKLGFPTANIQLTSNYVLPQEGVYYTLLKIDNEIFSAATSLGKNLTLNEEDVKIEAHILDFDRNIYGKDIEIRFVKKLRGMIKFDNLFDLTQQVLDDTKTVARSHKGNETETR